MEQGKMLKIAAHPGEIIKDELEERGMTPTELARQLAVPPNRLLQIISGKRAVTADTALRLAHWFGNDPQLWMNLQAQFDLVNAEKVAGGEIERLPTAGEDRPIRT